ncbi:Collagen alpha-6(VI) chain [Triplophysa tibetana]|uniref:Collagen alpha-6(VI) chain n=1 Tax=Triplophysa tibetana TaxID=1572043 RepID=A0A5A9N0F1_9TELE|nr:Collagen alpha-6(VI) chain [Triplophysa tibetana]
MDSSSSIAVREFRDMKAFIRDVVKGMEIDSKNVQVGLVQFSIDPHKEIMLGDYANKADLFKKIDKIPLRQGGTFMGKAMTFLNENYFTSAGGSRIDQKVPQIVVVVTDGDSTDDIKAPVEALRAKGIIIFAIGVGETNSTQMRSIASSPPERFVVNIENYEALKELTTTMMKTVCVLMKDQGKAIAQKFADVFVLVDSSATTKKQEIRDFLTQLAVNLKVGDGSNKIALAQFGVTVVKEFLFSDYMDTAEAEEFITRFEPKPNGDRKLGNAMDYVFNNFLNTESGSRISKGYKQYILVMRVGESSDSVLGATRRMENEDVPVIDVRLETDLRPLTPVISGYDFQQDITQIVTDIIETEVVLNVTGDCKSAQVADIVFIVDESGSIGEENFDLMRQFLHRIVSGLVVEPESVRVGLVLYSDNPSAEFFLDSFGNKIDILNYIKILPYRGGGTKTGAALTFAKDNLFTPTRGSRKALGFEQIAIIITDGKSQDVVNDAAAKLRRSGVTVFAVGVKNASSEELLKIASYPQKQFMFNVESFQMLTSLEKSLSKTLCKDVVDRMFDKDKKHTLKQACVNTEEADIYFLLDTSGGTRADFEDVKNFILYLLNLFKIGKYGVRAGIVKADHTPTLQFSVKDHKTRETLEKDVRNMLRPSGGTEMGVALTYVAERFREANVSRPANVQNILIIITDKKSQDDVSDPTAELSNLGVLVYAVGVGGAYRDYLLKMTDDSKVFYVTNYDALDVIQTDVLTDICSQEACRSHVADIMFLIDGSTSIAGSDFISMKTFINKFVNGSVIGRDDVHIGVVQFSTHPKEEFPLNRFYDKTTLQEEIKNISQLTGDTYTGRALEFVSPYFDEARGGRPGISQFLIVITDGVAHDGKDAATNANAIRDKSVVIYSIGVGSADTSQLEAISGGPDKVYLEKDFEGIQTLDKDLQFKMCYTVTDCQKELLADVIFLVQCTSQIRSPEFQKNILTFLISVVNSTRISDNLIRIGVIVYSDTPSQFTLNQYSSKHQVLDSIKKLTYSTGNANTAKALEYSLAYFNEERGGRQKRGIPQMLYLITDGPARDKNNLKARAEEYAAKQIQVYGIGVANAKRSELEIITKNKNNVFQVDNYKALLGLQNNISGMLCNMSKPGCKNEVADVVFLIDASESIKENPWKTMIAFLLDLVDKLRVTRDLFRIGVAQFSTGYLKEFYLNEHADAKGVKSAIQNITQKKGGTSIGLALRNVVEFFEESKGSRKQNGIPQNLVLITDGDSNDDVRAAADALRNMNINIFAIGIGDICMPELTYIAGSQDRLFLVENFDSLNLRTATFVDALCTDYPSNNPSCSIDIAIGFDISTTSSSSPSIFKSQERLQFSLHKIVHDVSVVHNLCCATEPTINNNIGFRLVSADGQKLNDYMFAGYSEEVVNKVVGLQNPQGLKFNSRLLGSFQEMFKASNSYIKVLIIFTDGLDEPIEELLDAAEKLRKSGVHALLTVALDGFRNTADLQRLEFGRGFGYKQLLSIGMQNVASVMQKEIGVAGEDGLNGVDGEQGEPGLDGFVGEAGDAGRPGERGDTGLNGGVGPKGNSGRGVLTVLHLLIVSLKDSVVKSIFENRVTLEGQDLLVTLVVRGCLDTGYVDIIHINHTNKPKCPAYPTDLVIGLDMSGDVTPQAFERMRSTVFTLLDNINVVESNCPTGARVAVVSYNSYTKYLIRFTDYNRKQELIQAIQRIALKTSSSRRNIGSAMRFVGRNMFKRVRKATLMRKVAIFLSNGESQDTTSLTTAILEYKALKINLGVIGLRNVPSIRRAFQADESQSFIFTVLGARDNQKASLSKIQNCVVCFDPCRPEKECDGTNLQPSPQEVDLDLALIVDGSRSILADQYEGVKEVLGTVLDQIVVSSQPSSADGQARVALYQQSSTYSEAQSGVKVIFNFQQFQDHSLMKRSIHQELKQTGGSSRLGLAMEYAIMQSILTAPKARKNKMVLAIVGEHTAYHDRAKLDFISRLAKCEGVVLFTMTVGDHFNNTQAEEMASYPLEQHIIRLGQLKDGEQEYAQRFLRTFFHILSTNVKQETEETEDAQYSGRGDSLRLAQDEGTQCHLDDDTGIVCDEHVARWYYNGAIGACLPFWYGGCGGNSNRFASEKECLQTCGKPKPELPVQKEETTIYDDACLMKQNVGPCSQFVLKWYYDTQQNECVYFWFGGCEGNKNRFDTHEQCEALCVQKT